MGSSSKKCGTWFMIIFGTILTVVGIAAALFWRSLYYKHLTNELILSNTSLSYNLWKETPIPTYLSLYLFNWTNAYEVLQKKWAVKPKLEQCGPYVLSEHYVRVNVTWNGNGTITYQQKRIWHFVPELSNGSLSDKIINLNPIASMVGQRAKSMNTLIKKLVNFALKDLEHGLIISKTVDELLITGYHDAILDIVSKLKIKGLDIPINKFGWFYSKNNSATFDGTFTIYTGKSNIELLGMVNLWNGQPNTSAYKGCCGYINGTSSGLFPPMKDNRPISIFSSDICSSLPIQYKSNEMVNNIPVRRFIGTDYTFDNGTKYADQACFQSSTTTPSGIRDVGKCRFGIPIFVSYPHFYLADPSYQQAVEGIHPNKTEHETFMLVEPTAGIPIGGRAQLQINLHVEPIEHMNMFDNIKPTYMPMLWFRGTATLTEQYANMIKLMLILNNVGVYVGWTISSVGIILVTIGIHVLYRKDRENGELERLLADTNQIHYTASSPRRTPY